MAQQSGCINGAMQIPCVTTAVATAQSPEKRLAMTALIATGIALVVIGALALQGVITGVTIPNATLLLGFGGVMLTPLAVMVVMSTLCCPALTVNAICPEGGRS